MWGVRSPIPRARPPRGHKSKRRKKQPGVGGGYRFKLPDVDSASGLFWMALRELEFYISLVEAEESWLEGNMEEGEFKGKHFITHNVDREALEVARREEFTDSGWRELCEQYGADPNSDQIALSQGEATPGGVSRTPSALLTALIAAYAITNLPLRSLVKALHHEPDLAAWEKIAVNMDDLHKVAGHLATRVRGGVVERGTGITEVPREEHFVAWLIQDMEKEGLSSDEEMLGEMKKTFPSLSDGLTVNDIDRIRRERLEPPE
jgi:hypothetical protein